MVQNSVLILPIKTNKMFLSVKFFFIIFKVRARGRILITLLSTCIPEKLIISTIKSVNNAADGLNRMLMDMDSAHVK